MMARLNNKVRVTFLVTLFVFMVVGQQAWGMEEGEPTKEIVQVKTVVTQDAADALTMSPDIGSLVISGSLISRLDNVTADKFPNLAKLSITFAANLRSVPSLNGFKNLKCLILNYLPNIDLDSVKTAISNVKDSVDYVSLNFVERSGDYEGNVTTLRQCGISEKNAFTFSPKPAAAWDTEVIAIREKSMEKAVVSPHVVDEMKITMVIDPAPTRAAVLEKKVFDVASAGELASSAAEASVPARNEEPFAPMVVASDAFASSEPEAMASLASATPEALAESTVPSGSEGAVSVAAAVPIISEELRAKVVEVQKKIRTKLHASSSRLRPYIDEIFVVGDQLVVKNGLTGLVIITAWNRFLSALNQKRLYVIRDLEQSIKKTDKEERARAFRGNIQKYFARSED